MRRGGSVILLHAFAAFPAGVLLVVCVAGPFDSCRGGETLIPIGIDRSLLRHVPWLSFTMIGLWVLLQILGNLGGSEKQLQREYTDLVEYYRAHRYVTVLPRQRPELVKRLFFETVQYFDRQEHLLTLSDEARRRMERLPVHQQVVPPPVVPQVDAETADRDSRHFAARVDQFLRNYTPYRYGLWQPDFSVINLFTYFWVHPGLILLLLNLSMFYFTAPLVEDRWGVRFFAGYLLAAGLVTGLLFYVLNGAPRYPVVGSSGIVAAVAAVFLVRHYDARFVFFYATRFGSGTFTLPAWLVLGAQILFLGLLVVSDDGFSGHSFWLYVWGYAFGFGTALVLHLSGYGRQIDKIGIDLDDPEHNPMRAATLAQKTGKGDPLAILAQGVVDYPEMINLRTRYWTTARQARDEHHLGEAGPWMFEFSLKHNDIETAATVWLTLREAAPEVVLPFDEGCFLAGTLIENGAFDRAGAVIVDLQARQAQLTPAQRLQLALQAGEWRHDVALAIAEPLVHEAGLDASERETLAFSLAFWRDHPDKNYVPDPNVRVPIGLAEYQQPLRFDRDQWGDDEIAQTATHAGAHAIPLAAMPTPPWMTAPTLQESVETRLDAAQPPPETRAARPEAVAMAAPPRAAQSLFAGVAEALTDTGLTLVLDGRQRQTIPFQRVNGLVLALVAGQGLVLDLVFGRPEQAATPLRVIRLQPDEAAGRRLFPEVRDGRTALVLLARHLRQATSAQVLLGDASLQGPDLPRFQTLTALHQKCYPGRVLIGRDDAGA